MRYLSSLLLFSLLLLLQPHTAAAVKIVATLPALGQIAEGVAGAYADVRVLAHVGQDPHFVPPKPTLARHLADADLLVAAGLGLEVGWLPPLLEASRNMRIRPNTAGYIDGSMIIPRVLGKPRGKISRELGDIHPEGNPHWWLDPENGVRLARALAKKLAVLDPAHAGDFRAHAEQLAAEV
ncbi:MAG: zinc ABC transporter substrate-binding protein, partial [Zetaproteobacteria bacterium]